MIKKENFDNLKRVQKERVVAALFNAKYQGFSSEAGITIKVPAGYNIRVAALLKCEEKDEIVKKIFVILGEFNESITSFDIDTVVQHAEELEKTGTFKKERDELWLIVNKKWTFEAYEHAKGKIVLMDMDALIEGINKYYSRNNKKSRELRDVLRHYGLIT